MIFLNLDAIFVQIRCIMQLSSSLYVYYKDKLILPNSEAIRDISFNYFRGYALLLVEESSYPAV